MNKQTPKHFAMQLGALAALYTSLTALLVIIFSLISLKFPDDSFVDMVSSTQEGMRMAFATLIVFFPAYIVLTRITNQTRRKESGGDYTPLARWLIYLSLLVAGGVLLGDLVTLINEFLNGEITVRFLLKAASLFVVISLAFCYYLLDIRGYFTKRKGQAVYFAIGAVILVVATLICAVINMDSPTKVREMRIDSNQISDLQTIEWRVQDYYSLNDELPNTLTAAFGEIEVPAAPKDREEYTYQVTGSSTYELCANFAYASESDERYVSVTPVSKETVTWEHKAGHWCFVRVVTAEALRY